MHHKRKRPRTQSDSTSHCHKGSRRGEAPSWWNILFAHRARRRRTLKTVRAIFQGADWKLRSGTWATASRTTIIGDVRE